MKTRTRNIVLDREPVDVTASALRIIDDALRDFAGRRLVSSVEAVDLLLDVRSAIALDAACAGAFDRLETLV